jgi:hypothetical protein
MRVVATITIMALCCAPALAAERPAYPQKGQDKAQQQADRSECRVWGMEQSGFDPATPQPQPQQAQRKRGGVVKGALIGGAAGEIIDDKGGEGAAVGGLIGGMRQASKNQQAQAQASSAYQQQMASWNAGQAAYGRAWDACMNARGYSTGG